jgi:hydrogenase expression/formation protein HypC
MCQGIPRSVIEVARGRLRVDVDGASRWMQASDRLTREVQPGNYVIVYAGVAIEAVSREEAEEQLKFLADLEAQFPDTEFPEAST